MKNLMKKEVQNKILEIKNQMELTTSGIIL
jgi:hypothetical protein